MADNRFRLVDASTGAFLRVSGANHASYGYLDLDGDAPIYETDDIVDIHRLAMEAASPSPLGRRPDGLPSLRYIEGEFFPVTVKRNLGAIVPGGEHVDVSTTLLRVHLEDIKAVETVRSRDFKSTPRIILKNYLPPDVISRLDAMSPEFLVVRGSEAHQAGDFILSKGVFGAKVGEIVHIRPLPDNWPMKAEIDTSGLCLALVDYASNTPSYSLSEIEPTPVAAPIAPRF